MNVCLCMQQHTELRDYFITSSFFFSFFGVGFVAVVVINKYYYYRLARRARAH